MRVYFDKDDGEPMANAFVRIEEGGAVIRASLPQLATALAVACLDKDPHLHALLVEHMGARQRVVTVETIHAT